MARYDGSWWVQRYYITGDYGKPAGRRDVDGPMHRRKQSNTFHPGYVGMWFPRALYPTKNDLPWTREELPIWPEPSSNPSR